ncbi:V-type immunoglobulin domain-containing suppressor of T-cell activation [Menidia menidia]
MEWETSRPASVWGGKCAFWLFSVLLAAAGAKVETSHPTLDISALHLHYSCPEGATAKLVCTQKGATKFPSDVVRRSWLFTSESNQHCVPGKGPRHINNHLHPNQTAAVGLQIGHSHENMWVVLQNVTSEDQGLYCCLLLDTKREHNHLHIMQKSHSHIFLHVEPKGNGRINCTFLDPTTAGGTVPVTLALLACILALLSLPLILVLVYKQRQNSQSGRRAQELVRMDSEALGHENPVFLGESPQTKTRTVSQIMTRQSSETHRHLLSDPGTPLSPPAHGDVFFPSEDTILESPDLLQV